VYGKPFQMIISPLLTNVFYDNGCISLESCKVDDQHNGANDGNIKLTNHTGRGVHGQWHVVLDEKVWCSLIRGVVIVLFRLIVTSNYQLLPVPQ